MESFKDLFDATIRVFMAASPFILWYMSNSFNKKLKKQDEALKERDKKLAEENKVNEDLRKKSEEEREERFKKFISDNIEDLKIKVVNMEMILSNHVDDTDFRMQFQDAVRNKARQNIIVLDNFLDQNFKNILSNWADRIEDYGLDWYDNIRKKHDEFDGSVKKRVDKKEIDDYLTHSMDVMISDFDAYIDFISDEMKIYNGKKVFFSQFITQQSLHNKTEILKMRLVQNGFRNNKEIIQEFRNHIDDFFSTFTKLLTIWNALESYDQSKDSH